MLRRRVPWKSHKFSFNILADIVLITYRDTNANDIRHDDRMHPDDGVTENEPTHRDTAMCRWKQERINIFPLNWYVEAIIIG